MPLSNTFLKTAAAFGSRQSFQCHHTFQREYQAQEIWPGQHLYRDLQQRWSGIEILLRRAIIPKNVVVNLLTSIPIEGKHALKFCFPSGNICTQTPIFSQHVQKTAVANTDPCVSKQLNHCN